MNNLILQTDSYKYSHYLQYPPGSSSMFSYFESRGGEHSSTIFFGLQYYLKKYLTGSVITLDMVEEARSFLKLHGEPFNYDGWRYIAENLGGLIPIRIRAVPEGTLIPNFNVLFTVESTDPKVFWITSFFETLLVRLWYPITVVTRDFYLKRVLLDYWRRTSDASDDMVAFQLHDFGARGVSSGESAEIGGMSHLVNFLGSDTVEGVWAANKYYNMDMAGFSIPASEHSTITSWGREHEVDAFENMINKFGSFGSIFACVSDSYDIWNAVLNLWGGKLYNKILASGATLVVRPDSGDPITVVCRILHMLEDKFGVAINSKGYRVLNHVRVIQGDGIDYTSLVDILEAVVREGFSTENVAFGMGGGMLQRLNRDTQRFAYKCSSITIDGDVYPVYKAPVTDIGKRSKSGRLDLIINTNGEYETVSLDGNQVSLPSTVMNTVFDCGQVLINENLSTIRYKLS